MSFQGDVAGIGLGELLQGLARGGRDGVLSLYGERLSAALGLKGGQLFILSGPDEEEETWRERAQRAWADNPSPELELNRRRMIARAERLEILYKMLEAANLSFRFEPGPLPPPPSHLVRAIAMEAGSESNPWGPGVTVEYLLLEHARIADESSSGPGATLSATDMPRVLDIGRHAGEVRDFLQQCDGTSTLQEIGDRLGWTLTQARVLVGQHMAAGNLRLAQPRELLASAQRELGQSRPGRAASRLTGWVRGAPPGPPPFGDADLLIGEWERGRIGVVLAGMRPRDARALLRKLDHVHVDARASRERWIELLRWHKSDDVALLHEVALRLVSTDEPEGRTYQELLHLARTFQERGFHGRTRTLLRLATNHLPSRLSTRIELGKRMLSAGLTAEGERWLLDTGRELLDQEDPERAMVPIRAVLKVVPEHPEAKGMLAEARSAVQRRKRRRWNTMAGLSAGLILSAVALVQFRSHREIESLLGVVNSHVDDPDTALQILEDSFPGDDSARIAETREHLQELKAERDRRLMEAWTERFQQVEEECKYGDPLLGLRRALELPPPPSRAVQGNSWPERQDLLGVLANRLGERSSELDVDVLGTEEDLKSEARLASLLKELLSLVDPGEEEGDVASFRFRLSELHQDILDRRETRAVERENLMAREKEQNQDILLATARAHDQAGDLERSLSAYERLIESDPTLEDIPQLQEEIQRVRSHWGAVREATRLSEEGRHEEAADALDGICPRPVEHLLPWKVDSRPSGARVTLPDGGVRSTPFVARSGVGEHVELHFQFEGHQPGTIVLDHPRDVVVDLHRFAERRWDNDHRVEAVPVPVGDDHVVTDRLGRIKRLDKNSDAAWQTRLQTLGGIARTPVFLPGRPGTLVVLSEDGLAWLVDAGTGKVEGPRDVGSPPREGPTLTRGGVSARFADGRVAVWSERLEPSFYSAEGMVQHPPGGGEERDASMTVLRASVDRAEELVAPRTRWLVRVLPEAFRVVGPDGRGFTAERQGAWSFVAWEGPKALVPQGRLWVSDELGLRSYLPHSGSLVEFD